VIGSAVKYHRVVVDLKSPEREFAVYPDIEPTTESGGKARLVKT
jgi:hypothetical protein